MDPRLHTLSEILNDSNWTTEAGKIGYLKTRALMSDGVEAARIIFSHKEFWARLSVEDLFEVAKSNPSSAKLFLQSDEIIEFVAYDETEEAYDPEKVDEIVKVAKSGDEPAIYFLNSQKRITLVANHSYDGKDNVADIAKGGNRSAELFLTSDNLINLLAFQEDGKSHDKLGIAKIVEVAKRNPRLATAFLKSDRLRQIMMESDFDFLHAIVEIASTGDEPAETFMRSDQWINLLASHPQGIWLGIVDIATCSPAAARACKDRLDIMDLIRNSPVGDRFIKEIETLAVSDSTSTLRR